MKKEIKKVIELVAESLIKIRAKINKKIAIDSNSKEEEENLRKNVKGEEKLVVPFSIATKLTELGYSWPTHFCYIKTTFNEKETIVLRDRGWIDYYRKKEYGNPELYIEIYPAPTILDSIDFLYDSYNVEIDYDLTSKSYTINMMNEDGICGSCTEKINTTFSGLSDLLIVAIEEAIKILK